MAFVFPLETVRRLRRSLETQEERRLLAIAASLAQARNSLEALESERMDLRREEVREMEAGAFGAVLNYGVVREASLDAERRKVLQQITDLERLREDQIGIYRQARQKREILDSLRERRLADYTTEEARREQARMDELFLANRASRLRQQDLPTR
jgi:flagellar export protein FliJ